MLHKSKLACGHTLASIRGEIIFIFPYNESRHTHTHHIYNYVYVYIPLIYAQFKWALLSALAALSQPLWRNVAERSASVRWTQRGEWWWCWGWWWAGYDNVLSQIFNELNSVLLLKAAAVAAAARNTKLQQSTAQGSHDEGHFLVQSPAAGWVQSKPQKHYLSVPLGKCIQLRVVWIC